MRAVDPDHGVMMSSLDNVGEGGAEGSGSFEMTAATAGDEVDGASLVHRLVVIEGPGAFVGMNVAVPDEVDVVLMGKVREVTGVEIAAGAFVGLPEFAVVVLVSGVGGLVMAEDFPVFFRFGKLLGEPFVLLRVGVAFLVGIDHEEAGVAVGEGVIVFGCWNRNVVVIMSGVLFVVSEDGEEGDEKIVSQELLLKTIVHQGSRSFVGECQKGQGKEHGQDLHLNDHGAIGGRRKIQAGGAGDFDWPPGTGLHDWRQ